MSNRLTKIYTRTGDDGTTGLGNGKRIAKNAARVDAFGTIDEINSFLGLLLSEPLPQIIHEYLQRIQHELFDLGGELSIPALALIEETHITRLEQWLDELNSTLPPLKEFVLPGGTRTASLCHVTRTICRRAERKVVSLSQHETINPYSIKYINRLSDLLFVIARYLNHLDGNKEILWLHDRGKK